MLRTGFTAFLLVVTFLPAFAQKPQPATSTGQQPSEPPAALVPQKVVAEQFGAQFSVLPGLPVLTADMDGDGTEDAFIPATGKNPLLDEAEYHYKTIDPYDEFYGFGDPRVTLQFSTQEGPGRYLLIVQDWKSATPKSKFVAINLPFEKLRVSRILAKKKTVSAVEMTDRTGQISYLFWNGKQWKWVETGTGEDF